LYYRGFSTRVYEIMSLVRMAPLSLSKKLPCESLSQMII
jgi:hypothetical protein